MAFFNEFKEKFNKAAQSVTSKTKDGVEITRLAGEGRGINNEITGLYEQIGRIYVESKGTDYKTLAPLCARVEELKQRLEEIERQKSQLRNQNRCPACGAGMPKGARYCSSCGRRMPENTTEAETAPVASDVCYCPDCGAMREEDAPFCAVCGYSYNAEPKDETPKPSAQPVHSQNEDSSDEAPTDYDTE